MLPWKRANILRSARPLVPALILALALAGLAWAVQSEKTLLGPVGVFLGTWVVFGALTDLLGRTGRGSFGARFDRLTRLPRADWGRVIAHSGLGVTMVGIAGLMAWEQEDIRVVQIGTPWTVGAYEFTLDDVNRVEGPNYLSTMGDVTVRKDGDIVTTLHPEKRTYPVQPCRRPKRRSTIGSCAMSMS